MCPVALFYVSIAKAMQNRVLVCVITGFDKNMRINIGICHTVDIQ